VKLRAWELHDGHVSDRLPGANHGLRAGPNVGVAGKSLDLAGRHQSHSPAAALDLVQPPAHDIKGVAGESGGDQKAARSRLGGAAVSGQPTPEMGELVAGARRGSAGRALGIGPSAALGPGVNASTGAWLLALDVAAKLRSWADAWHRDVVIDTHPGAASLTYAAMAAADLVVVPVVLAGRELDALEGLLAEAAEFRLLLVPNRVARWPDLAAINRLEELATRYQVPVTPGISDHHWWPRRKRRTAVGAATPPGGALARAQAELHQLAESVRKEAAR